MSTRPKSSGHLCVCGCGQEARKYYRKGKLWYYGKLAPGCKRTYTDEFRKKISSLMKGPKGINSVPPGSRYKHRSGKNVYWCIKLPENWEPASYKERRGWMFEHRYVTTLLLGRKLKRTEHVHHKNGNTLDNRPENLIVLGNKEHMRLTGKERFKKGLLASIFFPNCEVCGYPHPPH